jgi:hypothetical protein
MGVSYNTHGRYKNSYRILVGKKTEYLGLKKRSIKKNLQNKGHEDVDWIQPAISGGLLCTR